MSEVSQLITTLKRLLKAQGLTYRAVAQDMGLSEASVKRLFSNQRFTLGQLAQLSQLLGYTLAELLAEATSAPLQAHSLSEQQEGQLVSDELLLLVAVCVFNHWSAADIVACYRLSPAACLKKLLVLDRMGVISLLPGDRIRLRVARDFDWLPDGPIRRYFKVRGLRDFLDARFEADAETMDFAHGMLTAAAQAEFQGELRRLRARLAALHSESNSAALGQRRGTGVLLAMREWEPEGFRRLRRA